MGVGTLIASNQVADGRRSNSQRFRPSYVLRSRRQRLTTTTNCGGIESWRSANEALPPRTPQRPRSSTTGASMTSNTSPRKRRTRPIGDCSSAAATIATWATQNLDAAFRPLCMDELGCGVSSALHEVEAVSAAGKKCFFCGPHFLRSKNRSAHSAGS